MAYAYDVPKRELHHRIPQCLLTLRDRTEEHAELDGDGIELWMIYEWECSRFGIHPDISRDDLAGMIERSAYYVKVEDHRQIHADDFCRWGSRGGMATYKRYGRAWFVLLARKRWNKVTSDVLAAYLEEITAYDF